MKKLIFLIIAIFIFIAVKAQTIDTASQSKKDSSVFLPVDKVPEFPGGMERLFHYIEKNLKYPKEARNNNVEGTVKVSFVIERDGSLTNIKVERSLSPETDAEAIRLMNNSPKWIPGMQGNHPVRVQYSLPIYFRLNN